MTFKFKLYRWISIDFSKEKNKILIGNRKPTRDFNYVKDVVKGLIKITESEAIGEVINIGTGREISIGELVKKIVALSNKNCEILTDPKRIRPSKSEVMRLCADNSKMKKLTGWEPEVSLDKGLRLTMDWIKDNLNLYKVNEYQI